MEEQDQGEIEIEEEEEEEGFAMHGNRDAQAWVKRDKVGKVDRQASFCNRFVSLSHQSCIFGFGISFIDRAFFQEVTKNSLMMMRSQAQMKKMVPLSTIRSFAIVVTLHSK